MSGTRFWMIAAAAVTALVAALWAVGLRDAEVVGPVQQAQLLLPGLKDELNNVTGIEIFTDQQEPVISVVLKEDRWQLTQKDGYPADTAKLTAVLVGLADAHLLEQKTSNPDFYARLGVGDGPDADNISVQLVGVNHSRLIIGDSATSRNGFYVRRYGQPDSWLVSGSVDIQTVADQWLERQIIELEQARIAEVVISHADGSRLQLAKEKFGQEHFDVADIPKGRSLTRPDIADPVAAALEDLSLVDVQKTDDIDWPQDATTIEFKTFDGLIVRVSAAVVDEKPMLRLGAMADAGLMQRFQPQTDNSTPELADAQPTDQATDQAADQTKQQPDIGGIAQEAESLNQRFDGWVYQVAQYKYDQLITSMESLLATEQ